MPKCNYRINKCNHRINKCNHRIKRIKTWKALKSSLLIKILSINISKFNPFALRVRYSSIFLIDNIIIHSRRIELQSFTDRICRHPVLAGSEVQPLCYQNIFRLSSAHLKFNLFFSFYQNIFWLFCSADLNRPRCGNILCQRPMRRSGQRWASWTLMTYDDI